MNPGAASRPSGAHVLLIDLTWDVHALLAAHLLARGLRVSVLTHGLRWSARGLPFEAVTMVSRDEVADVTVWTRSTRLSSYDAVVAGSEAPARTLLRHPGVAPGRTVPASSLAGAADLLGDKAALIAAAAHWGVTVAESVPLADPGDLPPAARRLGLPLVVKGAGGFGGHSVRICADVAGAEREAARMLAAGEGPVTVQAHYAGGTAITGGVARDGAVGPLMLARVVEQSPPGRGPAVTVETTDDPAVARATRAVAEGLGWTGPLSCDFVADADGRWRLIDVNPRLWTSVWAAERAGVGMLDGIVALIEGRPLPVVETRPGVRTRLFPRHLVDGREIGLPLARRIAGLRDAPLAHRQVVAREVIVAVARRWGLADG